MAHKAIAEHARAGGSTFDPRTGDNLSGTRNIAVGIAPEHAFIHDKPFTAQDHDNFVAAHHEVLSKHSHSAVGTYHDSSTGLHHMEIVGLTPSKNAALDMAGHMGEKHVYNLATDDKIPTGEVESKPSHLSVDQRFDHLRAASPKRETYSGTHFSDKPLDKIEGARRGELGAKKMPATNADSARVHLGTKTGLGPDAPGGFYSIKAGEAAPALAAAKQHSYRVRGQFAFGSTESPEFKNGYAAASQHALAAGAKPDIAHHLGLNAAEHALQDAGYDGYHSPAHPNVRFHFGDHEAVPVAAHEKLDAQK
jgi:hypothetical protein